MKIFRLDFRAFCEASTYAFLKKSSWIREQENPKTECQKAAKPEYDVSWNDFGSHYLNPR